MKPAEFIKTYGDALVIGTEGTPIFPSVKAAQMILETGWGEQIKGNNAFGIKAAGQKSPFWQGDTIEFSTSEYFNGLKRQVTGLFRKYLTLSDSIQDHTHFLAQNPRYKAVFAARTPEEQAQALQGAGYATDPTYANKLISLIKAYNLKSLDEKKKL